MTFSYQVFLARWAKRLSWKETADIFETSWDTVFRAVQFVVDYGLAHRSLEGVTEIGVDEIKVFKGHKYLTLVYQLNAGVRRLLWCGPEHRAKTLLRFFQELLLKRPENLTEKQTTRLGELLKLNLASIKGYLLREDFQRFWEYQRPDFAGKFLDNWVTRALQTDLEPMKKVARMLRSHKPLILNWFKAKGQLSSGAVEGLNLKAKLTMRKAFGFRTLKCLQIALYHELGKLPEPEYHHRFC
jgi:transposase